jgi:hypothetical protein
MQIRDRYLEKNKERLRLVRKDTDKDERCCIGNAQLINGMYVCMYYVCMYNV